MQNTWNPELYLKFEKERTRPSIDLVSRISLSDPKRIIDIGCGPGNSTRVLRERFPEADIYGLDSSPEMIVKAERSDPSVQWVCANATTYEYAGSYDVIFSNATLQWIPNHEKLLLRLLDHLAPCGMLAVQVPGNQNAPLQIATRTVGARKEWVDLMQNPLHALHYKDSEFYYNVLTSCRHALDFSIWETTYLHLLDSIENIIDWYRSTGMKPYLAALPDDETRTRFTRLILENLNASNAYPATNNGKVIFPFRRVFFTACNNRNRNG